MRDSDDIRGSQVPMWPIAFSVVAVGALLVGMLVLMPLFGRGEYKVGLYDANKPVAEVLYHGEHWAPTGPVVKVPDVDMVAVGHSDEGYYLYVNAERDLVGGGGGKPETGANANAYHQIYMRTKESTYVPLVRR